MEINLDNLLMTLCGIPDVRLLWSQDKRLKVQFSTLQVGQTQVARYTWSDGRFWYYNVELPIIPIG